MEDEVSMNWFEEPESRSWTISATRLLINRNGFLYSYFVLLYFIIITTIPGQRGAEIRKNVGPNQKLNYNGCATDIIIIKLHDFFLECVVQFFLCSYAC